MVQSSPGRGGVGLRNVGSYQISGHPYMTGSTMNNKIETKVEFPFVTQEITIWTSGSELAVGPTLRVHFNSTGSSTDVIGAHHYLTIAGNAACAQGTDGQQGEKPMMNNGVLHLNVKCKNIYITCVSGGATSGADQGRETHNGYELYASLTNVGPTHMYELTGSGISDGPNDWA